MPLARCVPFPYLRVNYRDSEEISDLVLPTQPIAVAFFQSEKKVHGAPLSNFHWRKDRRGLRGNGEIRTKISKSKI